MSEMESNETIEITGATLAGPPMMATGEDPAVLPMVVWLRGDEAYAADFDMTADEVMEKLGIKRSRLTQISGRDLRVGRMRIDRYVRPVYRHQDVEEYSSWTRATATHQKSSDLMLKAATELKEQSDQLREEAVTVISQSVEGMGEDLKSSISELRKGMSAHLSLIDERLLKVDQQQTHMAQTDDQLLDRTAPLGLSLQTLLEQSAQHKLLMDDATGVIQTLAQIANDTRAESSATNAEVLRTLSTLSETGERQQTAISELAKVVTVLLTHYKELAGKLEQQSQALNGLTKLFETEVSKGSTQDERYRIYLAMRRGYGLTNPLSRKS